MSRTMHGRAPLEGTFDVDHWTRQLSPLGERTHKVVWDISNKCNLRCRMCHFAFDEVFHRPAEYMTPETFERLAPQVLPHAHTLILSAGNEPMTSPWFGPIVEAAGRWRVPNFLFITNATRMTPALSEVIVRAGVTQVQVSIDGCTKDTYEYIRRGADFDKVVRNIRHLVQLRDAIGSQTPRLQFNIVLMRRNLLELPGFIDLAEDLGVDWIAARHLLVMNGLGMESESLALDPELANEHFVRFLDRANRSASVRVISFPDLFDPEALRQDARARRLVSHDAPFGVIDQPVTATVSLADGEPLALSGWALDADGIVGVTIERTPRIDESPADLNEQGRVHVADARTGIARGDVEAVYPDFRASAVAGWSVDLSAIERRDLAQASVDLQVVAHALNGRCAVIGTRTLERAPQGEAETSSRLAA